MKKLYMLMVFAITAVAAMALIVGQAGARGTYVPGAACGLCHVDPSGGGPRNATGQYYELHRSLPTTTASTTTTTARATTTTTAAATTTTTAAATTTTTTARQTTTTTAAATTTTAPQTTTTTAAKTTTTTAAPSPSGSNDGDDTARQGNDTDESNAASAYREQERRSAEPSRTHRSSHRARTRGRD